MKARETDRHSAGGWQTRGLIQAELGRAVGVSQRVIAYYDCEGGQPPGALLADLSRILKVTADELLGLKPATEKPSLKSARLRKRLQLVEELSAADQRTVLKLVDPLAEARRQTRPRTRARAASQWRARARPLRPDFDLLTSDGETAQCSLL